VNSQNFDLNLLLVIDAVFAEGGISRAAARLGLSQPAVSNALTRMRSATGDRLFVRVANHPIEFYSCSRVEFAFC